MLIFLGIVVVLLVLGGYLYNSAVTKKEAVINNHKMIDVQLDGRGKEIDSLVNMTKSYMKHENSIFTQLAELRAGAINAKEKGNQQERMGIENKIDEIIKQTKGFELTVENYPELKASELFLRNQEAIVSVERKLVAAKRAYNYSIEELKVLLEKFPNNLFFNIFGGKFESVIKEYPYWELTEEKRATQEEKRFDI